MSRHDQLVKIAERNGYKFQLVSWEDCQRGWNSDGTLGVHGSNITDVTVIDKNKKRIGIIRHQNWNEKVAVVPTSDIAVVVGNELPNTKKQLKSITLKQLLEKAGTFGAYAGVPANFDMSSQLDDKVSVRFQTAFLEKSHGEDTEFAINTYAYGSQNMTILSTAHGTSWQKSKGGSMQHYGHQVTEKGIQAHWLKTKETNFAVGQAQQESKESREEAVKQGLATAKHIGIKQMGTRFNVLMLIQVPTKHKRSAFEPMAMMSAPIGSGPIPECVALGSGFIQESCLLPSRTGKSSAARLGYGSALEETAEKNDWQEKNLQRHDSQRITVTITMYYMVENGIPSEHDIVKAITDLKDLYEKCGIVINLKGGGEPLGITEPKVVKMEEEIPANLNATFPAY